MNFFHSFFPLFRNTNQSIAIYESKLGEKMKMKCRNKRWCCHSWRHFEQCLTHSSRISSVLFSYADTLDRNVRTNEKKREENACSFLIIKQKRVGDDGREKKKKKKRRKKRTIADIFFLVVARMPYNNWVHIRSYDSISFWAIATVYSLRYSKHDLYTPTILLGFFFFLPWISSK